MSASGTLPLAPADALSLSAFGRVVSPSLRGRKAHHQSIHTRRHDPYRFVWMPYMAFVSEFRRCGVGGTGGGRTVFGCRARPLARWSFDWRAHAKLLICGTYGAVVYWFAVRSPISNKKQVPTKSNRMGVRVAFVSTGHKTNSRHPATDMLQGRLTPPMGVHRLSALGSNCPRTHDFIPTRTV